MKRFLMMAAVCTFTAVCCGALHAEASRPGWVARYLESPPEPWDGWRNSLAPQGDPAPPLTLAVDGETDYVIVIPHQPTRLDAKAADELQLWLGEITGAEFPIVPDTTPPQERELSVGVTGRAREAGLTQIAGLDRDGYAIEVRGERVYLLGGEQAGPLHAVFAFLEEDLGVRWYEPAIRRGSWDELTAALVAARWGPEGSTAPERPTLEAAIVPRVSNPAIPVRLLGWHRSYNPWAIRNRINGGYAHMYGQHGYVTGALYVHTFHRLVPPDEYFADHPEYFALVGGRRRWEQSQLCLSNPGVAQAAARGAAEHLRRVPRDQQHARYLLAVCQEDWLGDCECEECRAVSERLGSYGGLQVDFVNRVGELLEDEFPWAELTTLAYRQSKEPPTADIRARGNVSVRFCTDFGASFTWPYHSFYDETIAPQRDMYLRWREISPSMHLWIYPHQYRHRLAPMPSIRAVAENIRFFHEHNARSAFIEQSVGADLGREPMRFWVFSKLMWDPSLDVDELMQDFIWGTYGAAAPAVAEYHQLLWDHCARYTDFSRGRNWIYPIHDEEMYRHGFIEKAREILDRGLEPAADEQTRDRVELLKLGVVWVEAVQLYMQMRDGMEPPDVARYAAVARELADLCERLEVGSVGFYDGSRTISPTAEWLEAMREVWARRFDQRFLPTEAWGQWAFRTDPENRGLDEEWQAVEFDAEAWRPIDVPAFWAQTWARGYLGYGWYRTTFRLPEAHAGRPVELQFDGVDEQAWVYVNGEHVGEHTLESEFMVGQEVTVGDLWDRPFTITLAPKLLSAGENTLVVRVHASVFNGGIHQPVRIHRPVIRRGKEGSALAGAGAASVPQEAQSSTGSRCVIGETAARH